MRLDVAHGEIFFFFFEAVDRFACELLNVYVHTVI